MNKRLMLLTVLAGAIASCSPQPGKTEPSASPPGASEIAALPDPTGACAATATSQWDAGGVKYVVTGAAAGPTCDSGEAVLTIRDPATGKVVLSVGGFDVAAMSSTVFAEAKSPEKLAAALADWIHQSQPVETTASLPEWKSGDAQPMSGEFPFYPEEGATRETWAALRATNRPTFCHVQGMESSACYVLDPQTSRLTRIGLQSFPG